MERTSAENRELLRSHGLPELPDGEVTELRYRVHHEDWHARVDGQWYWLDAREGITPEWRPSILGPST